MSCVSLVSRKDMDPILYEDFRTTHNTVSRLQNPMSSLTMPPLTIILIVAHISVNYRTYGICKDQTPS